MITMILISLFSASASLARGGGELGPITPPCDLNPVNACRESERVAGLNSRAQAESLTPAISAMAPVVDRLRGDLNEAQARYELTQATVLEAKEEISFLARGEDPASPEIMVGFASAEDYFSLSSSEQSWQERYPTDREQRLNSAVTELVTDELDEKNQIQEISTKFGTLNGQYESLRSQQAHLFSDADSHASMSDRGCFQRICGH